MKRTGVHVLHWTGLALLVFSLVELLIEIFNVFHFDVLGLTENTELASLLFMRAGNFGVQMLFSVIGAAAGYVAIFLSENDQFNRYLRLFGAALIVMYLIEGLMVMAQADVFSWIRLAILLVLSALYLWGTWLLGKEDRQAEATLG